MCVWERRECVMNQEVNQEMEKKYKSGVREKETEKEIPIVS